MRQVQVAVQKYQRRLSSRTLYYCTPSLKSGMDGIRNYTINFVVVVVNLNRMLCFLTNYLSGVLH